MNDARADLDATRGFARPRVAIIGATGFIGNTILTSLTSQHLDVCALVRRRDRLPGTVDIVEARQGILDDKALGRALEGADFVINAASYTGDDVDAQYLVNAEGGERVARAASRAGVTRLIYVSTFGVYGRAFTPGIDETATPTPGSTLSASRLQAEEATLEYGGIVLRPALVLGAGDRWVLPKYITLLQLAGPLLNSSNALTSTVNKRGVAAVVSEMLRSTRLQHEIYHVAEQLPVDLRDVARTIAPDLLQTAIRRQAGIDSNDLAQQLGITADKLHFALNDTSISTERLHSEFPGSLLDQPRLTAEDVAWYRAARNH